MTEPRCTWDAERGWLTPEDSPCGKSHCELRGCASHVARHEDQYTCGDCINRTRKTIRRIAVRYAELPEQVAHVGINSEAMNLLGPAASAEQFAAGVRWSDRMRGWCDWPKNIAGDEQHPLIVLGQWDHMVRETYGHASDLFTTISRSVDYLTGDVLDRFANTREFEDFTRDVYDCLHHLEDVLVDSRKPEKGAPCPMCEKPAPKLMRRLAEHPWKFGEGEVCERPGCQVCAGNHDTWHCPANGEHFWTDVEYRLRVGGDYLAHATALTASQMHEVHGIKPGSLRGWASLGKVAKRGKDAAGLTLYDVAQAKAQVEGERMGA
jgi:hypothetical protein